VYLLSVCWIFFFLFFGSIENIIILWRLSVREEPSLV
jgi:hypothetical protein